MWCFNRRNLLKGALLLGVMPLLGGCGFKPLYGGEGHKAHEKTLAAIEINSESTRIGHYFSDRLKYRLGSEGTPRYRLKTTLKSSQSGFAIQSDDAVTRYNYHLECTYELVSLASSKVIFAGTLSETTAYNATTSQYATAISLREASQHVAEDIADRLTQRLTLHFIRHPES